MAMTSEMYREVLDNLHEGMYLVDQERKIVFWNSAAERYTGYPAHDVQGRQCRNILFRHTNFRGTCLCRDACPMERTFRDQRTREIDVYVHHRDGSRVLSRVQFSPFKDPAGKTVVAVTFNPAADSSSLRKRLYEERPRKAPHHEKLPSVTERREIERQLTSKIDEHRRYGWSFGVMFVAVDRFEGLIEQYGYPYAYKALRLVAEILNANLRTSDTVGRWNENEFIVVAMNIDSRGLKALAERMRILVAQSRLTFYKEQLSFTISVGASAALTEDTVSSLAERCAVLLRKSFSSGGNAVSL
jgi:diguanylate cyclase (GGDEF)-like protein/PAS domain S-box-containing protein